MNFTFGRGEQGNPAMDWIFSNVYVQVLHLIEVSEKYPFSIMDLFVSTRIRLVEDSSSRLIFRGYMTLECFENTHFQRVEFCVIYWWDRKNRKSKILVPPSEVIIMFGWDSTVDINPYLKMKKFGCKLFRGLANKPKGIVDVDLQPKNWTAPFLWGGEPPAFLKSDAIVVEMLEKNWTSCNKIAEGATVLTDREYK